MFKIVNDGKLPTKGSKYSAAVDLYASEDCIISAGETKIIGLGVCINTNILKEVSALHYRMGQHPHRYDEMLDKFKKAHYLELHLQRDLNTKGLISNTNIINMDEKDEIKIIIHNPIRQIAIFSDVADELLGNEEVLTNTKIMHLGDRTIKKGDKIAQILLKEHKSDLLGVGSDEERTGGFGSTGA